MAHGKGAPGRLQLYVDGTLAGNAEALVTTSFMLNPGALTCGANPGSAVTGLTLARRVGRYLALGWAGLGCALIVQVPPFVPGRHLREGSRLVLPGQAGKRRQPDDTDDHQSMEAAASQKTRHRA